MRSTHKLQHNYSMYGKINFYFLPLFTVTVIVLVKGLDLILVSQFVS
jgi:hypothetical protein